MEEMSEESSPLTVTTKPQTASRYSEEEIRQNHREWLLKVAVNSRRMALDPEYREKRSKMGF